MNPLLTTMVAAYVIIALGSFALLAAAFKLLRDANERLTAATAGPIATGVSQLNCTQCGAMNLRESHLIGDSPSCPTCGGGVTVRAVMHWPAHESDERQYHGSKDA